MKRKSWLTLLPLVFMTLLVIMFMERLSEPRMSGAIDSPLIGQPVPTDLNIKTNPPYIINVFASWCTPCAIEHPFLMDLQKRGVKIVGIAYKDTTENIEKYLKIGGNPFAETLFDDKGEMGITLGITGVPESFAVNTAGIIRARQQGPFADVASAATFAETLK